MRRAIALHPAGSWPAAAEAASVTLAFDDRHRRRVRLADDRGEPFLLDLPQAAILADGDGLALAKGGYLRVRAAAEPVAEVSASSPGHLAKLAWHLGNRHTPVQVIDQGRLRLRRDHVLEAMLEGLGGRVARTEAPFSPETGAYAHEH